MPATRHSPYDVLVVAGVLRRPVGSGGGVETGAGGRTRNPEA